MILLHKIMLDNVFNLIFLVLSITDAQRRSVPYCSLFVRHEENRLEFEMHSNGHNLLA